MLTLCDPLWFVLLFRCTINKAKTTEYIKAILLLLSDLSGSQNYILYVKFAV